MSFDKATVSSDTQWQVLWTWYLNLAITTSNGSKIFYLQQLLIFIIFLLCRLITFDLDQV